MFQLENVFLRKAENADLASLLVLKQETWPFNHRTVFLNIEDQNLWFKSLQDSVNQPKKLALIACNSDASNEAMGIFLISNIDYINQSADVSWALYSNYRGKGYGKAMIKSGLKFCFDVLNLRRINCEILSNNEPSIKCALSLGFILEGTKRESIFKLGKYIDSGVYGLMMEELK
jgi:RimJ/RimL family protein N-acetyltransferase